MTFYLYIKPKDETVKELYKDHKQGNGDAGLDVFFTYDVEVPPRALGFMVDLGIACQGILNDNPSSFYLLPRSSISKTPLRLSNSVGLIDSGYTGFLKAPLDNHSDEPVKLNRGQRLFQIVSPTLGSISFDLVEELTSTERGSGGFGSTGL